MARFTAESRAAPSAAEIDETDEIDGTDEIDEIDDAQLAASARLAEEAAEALSREWAPALSGIAAVEALGGRGAGDAARSRRLAWIRLGAWIR